VTGIVALDQSRDLVLLSVSGLTAPPLQVGDSNKVQVGDPVFAVGNPRGLEGTLSEGIVSAIRPVGADAVLQISAPISPGSSGGPVLDGSARVIGVAAATLKGGQNLNFAIPASYVSALLGRARTLTPLSPGLPKEEGSVINRLGGSKATGGVVVGQFQWGDYNIYLDSRPFTFSIRNQLSEAVDHVYCLAIFYDSDGKPVETYEKRFYGAIQAGLAKRVKGEVDKSVRDLSMYETPESKRFSESMDDWSKRAKQAVERGAPRASQTG
jgi:hypothetical protein